MKKKLLVIIVIFCFTSFYAQKSSPVMGDAATLIDLLKKDYNTSNPESRDEDIASDRVKVIAIFKSYLEDKNKKKLNANLSDTQIKKLNDYNDSYQNERESFATLAKNNVTITDKTTIALVQKDINYEKDKLTTLKNTYYKEKNTFDINELTNVQNEYKTNNPYLFYMIKLFSAKYTLLQDKKIDLYSEKNGYSSVQKSIPFLGGDMAFETVIDGLSRFLANRIKEELTVYAIDKIKTYLENPTPENYCYELLAIMPITTNYLKQFDANQLLNFTDELKQYIEQDLNNLLTNAVNLKDTPRLKNYISKNPDLEFAFEGLEIIPQLSKIKSPIDYFELLENSRTLVNWRSDSSKIKKFNIAQSLRLASMLAYSMTIVENGELKFASVDFVSNYGNEINFYFLYFGLLHQQNTKYFNVNFRKSNNTYALFDIKVMMDAVPAGKVTNATDNFKFLKSNLIAIAQNAEKVYSQGLAIKKKNKNNEEVKYDDIYSFINDFIGFSEEVITTADLLLDVKYNFITVVDTINTKKEIDLKNKLTPYFTVGKIANNVVMDLHQKKYANAIVRTIEIPLSFKTLTATQTANLENIKTTIESQKDLVKMKNLFVIDLTKLDNQNGPLIKQMKTSFEFLEFKFSKDKEKKETKAILTSIKDLNEVIDNKTATDKEIVAKFKSLKATFRNEYAFILKHFGINTTDFTSYLKSKLNASAQNKKVIDYLEKKVNLFMQDVFSQKVLNEPTSITIQTELSDFLNEFTSQSITSNTKITDNKAIKLIHFFNDISASKDSKDVEKAIDAFALPVGSSSLKEKACTYVSLNAFPGILFGNEHSDFEAKKDAFTIGFTAPVGLYVQLKSFTKGDTFGLFIPIIDIAAPVRLRLDDNNDTKTLPDFNFNDIFSPGLYFTYGFKKSPFAVNLGWQYGPKLRDIPDGNNGFTSVDSYRINLGITIDIPLLTLTSKYKD